MRRVLHISSVTAGRARKDGGKKVSNSRAEGWKVPGAGTDLRTRESLPDPDRPPPQAGKSVWVPSTQEGKGECSPPRGFGDPVPSTPRGCPQCPSLCPKRPLVVTTVMTAGRPSSHPGGDRPTGGATARWTGSPREGVREGAERHPQSAAFQWVQEQPTIHRESHRQIPSTHPVPDPCV